jgi:DNA polymerase phi
LSFAAEIEGDENDRETNEELGDDITEILQHNHISATVESADETDLDDDQMMAMDDQLALIFKDRARATNGKGTLPPLTPFSSTNRIPEGAQRAAMHFKNRVMDLLDIFIRRQPTSPHILQFLVPLLALTFSDEKQVSEKATGLLMSRIGKLKEIPIGIDAPRASDILKDLHGRARRVHSRHAVAIISRCSLYVSRALLHVGADEIVRTTYTDSLVDFTERKASDLNVQFFCDFIERYPSAAWGIRAALLAAPTKAINTYRQGQAYMLLETLLNHLFRLVGVVRRFVIPFCIRG